MDIFSALQTEPNETKEPDRTVVRLTTSAWHDENGTYLRKSLRYLKRKCEGWNCLNEEAQNVGADEALQNIENLYDCKDGIYEVVPCNFSYDWESGHCDGYELKLIPFKP